jgi:hypothetical protein
LKTLALALPLVLLAAGCAAPAVPVPVPPVSAPSPAPKPLAFGDEVLLREGGILWTREAAESLPAGTKVRITGPENERWLIPVLVLDPPHAGLSGMIPVSLIEAAPLTEAAPE